jgi:A/G-specific adenine glycosylase
MTHGATVAANGKKVKGAAGGRGAGTKTLTPAPRTLLAWYDAHRRIMPWRALPGVAANPYRVWLSEVMLQQTTVAAVVPYFQKFIQRWPTVRALAAAKLDDIMKMWAGLGYYRRAQSLYACAQRIVADYGGEFPNSYDELLTLPGFGPYTAAAVTSIAFDRRANVVDGNVERVMARIFAIREPMPEAKPKLRTAAATLLPASRHGDYAQALMDLGATICTPRNPKCMICPWNKSCRARALGIQDQLPVRAKPKAKPVRRAIGFVLMTKQNEILLRQRGKTGLLADMMEVPSSAWLEQPMPLLKQVQKQAPVAAKWKMLSGEVRHVFTHFELQMQIAIAVVPKSTRVKPPLRWVPVRDLYDEALPSVMRKLTDFALRSASIKTIVMPAKAGIHLSAKKMDPRIRGGDNP